MPFKSLRSIDPLTCDVFGMCFSGISRHLFNYVRIFLGNVGFLSLVLYDGYTTGQADGKTAVMTQGYGIPDVYRASGLKGNK